MRLGAGLLVFCRGFNTVVDTVRYLLKSILGFSLQFFDIAADAKVPHFVTIRIRNRRRWLVVFGSESGSHRYRY